MLESINSGNGLLFQELTPEEKQSRGILGRLTGPIASYKVPTRNQRNYSESLWENAFNGEIVKEMFANGGLIGQLEHPIGTSETDPTKICIIMREPPKKDTAGHLIGSVDILDTPCGQIAYALSKAGFKFGISSRGEGDLEGGMNGIQSVNPDTYELITFDLVTLPACKDARLQFTESLEKPFDYEGYLTESYKKFTPDEQKVMTEMWSRVCERIDSGHEEIELNIPLPEIDITIDESMSESKHSSKSLHKEAKKEKKSVDNSEDALLEELQSLLRKNQELSDRVVNLNEQLSVCYAKEVEYKNKINEFRSNVTKLTESSERENRLQEQLRNVQSSLKESKTENKSLIVDNKNLKQSLSESVAKQNTLQTQLTASNNKIKNLSESLLSAKESSEKTAADLNESIARIEKDSKLKLANLSKKLEESNKRIDSYKNVAQTAINKYIGVCATQIGVSPKQIQEKLPTNYSFKDIESVVESLKEYQLNISKLPFSPTARLSEGIVSGSMKNNANILPGIKSNRDDEIDPSLMSLAKII